MSTASTSRTIKFISKAGTYTATIMSPGGDLYQEYEGPADAPTSIYPDFATLQPTLYSERVKAHPLEIFLVILIAGSLAGILGMLLAIPSYTVIRVFAKEFFSQFTLVRKLTEKI